MLVMRAWNCYSAGSNILRTAWAGLRTGSTRARDRHWAIIWRRCRRYEGFTYLKSVLHLYQPSRTSLARVADRAVIFYSTGIQRNDSVLAVCLDNMSDFVLWLVATKTLRALYPGANTAFPFSLTGHGSRWHASCFIGTMYGRFTAGGSFRTA
jgi:hypothetical protein